MSMEKFVPLKNSLKQANKFQVVSDKILLNLKAIPNIEDHKLSVELIEYVCNLIEFYIKKKYKIDKENLLIFTLKRVLALSDAEIEVIKQHVHYLIDNKLIKAVTSVQKGLEYAKTFFKSKIV